VNKALAIFISLFSLTAFSVSQEARRIPPGIREADKATIASEKNIPPPQSAPPQNRQHLEQDAAELARLAGSIPADIERVHRGLLPADLKEKLKQIEKLSKRLRNGLAP
jgi:hypothetical protein